jgi:lipid-binding SYLF domain-containing protein
MINRKHFLTGLVTFILLVPGVAALGAKDLDEYRERSANAATVLDEIMGIKEGGIPEELMARATAIAVIPHVVKGALGIGGQYGKGLVSHRHADGTWSTPAFVDIGGGSFGLQIGVQATDLVLVFTNDSGFKGLLDGKVKLGADASVAAGPVGRRAEAGTDVLLKSAILAYSRSKGLFAGISLDGSALTINDSANTAVYGKEISAQDILLNSKVRTNDVVAPFLRVLEKYSPVRTKG